MRITSFLFFNSLFLSVSFNALSDDSFGLTDYQILQREIVTVVSLDKATRKILNSVEKQFATDCSHVWIPDTVIETVNANSGKFLVKYNCKSNKSNEENVIWSHIVTIFGSTPVDPFKETVSKVNISGSRTDSL